MASSPSDKDKNPSAETLKTQDETASSGASKTEEVKGRSIKLARHKTYRPSHKATFIGLAVVLAILALNAGVIYWFMRDRAETEQVRREEVVLSTDQLSKLGVSRNPVGDLGTELIVGPDARFDGKVVIGGDISVAGQFQLNSALNANQANLTRLEAGETSLGQLNVNGDGTVTNLAIREQISVVGNSTLQGPVTVASMLTVNNNANVAGNLSIGGTLSVGSFNTRNLVVGNSLTVGGHIVTRGQSPSVSRGPAVGPNGTVSISGSDMAGTVAVNTDFGAGNGIVANITFSQSYGNTPRVVITAVGPGAGSYYINRNANGFSIGVNGAMTQGGHAFDYIVMQ